MTPADHPEERTGRHGVFVSEPHGAAPPDERRCTATSKSTGERCRHLRMVGGNVCRHHGGAARQVRAKAAERVAASKARAKVDAALAHEALTGIVDPLEALGMLATEAVAMKDALARRVNALNELAYTAVGAGTEQLRAEVALYERALDRSARFLDLMAKNGVAERRIELQQAQAQIVIAAARVMLEALDLAPADRDRALGAFLGALGRGPEHPAEVVAGELDG